MRHASISGTVRHASRRNYHSRILRSPARSFNQCSHLLSPEYGPVVADPETHASDHEPKSTVQKIAVLGAGVTGLTTAFHLSRTVPNARITILEATSRIGGWINSERIAVDGGEILFEWGPRSLRPDLRGAGLATAVLLQQLGLRDNIVGISKWSEAALNRFIYYPDHLVRLPQPRVIPGFLNRLFHLYQTFGTLLKEPIFSGVLSALIREFSLKPRSPELKDESVGDFLQRRFGSSIANNLASALYHGIYAGDIYQLSARTLLPVAWHLEQRDPDGGSVLAEALELLVNRKWLASGSTMELINYLKGDGGLGAKTFNVSLRRKLADSSLYTFANGLDELVRELEAAIRQCENITIKTTSPVQKLSFNPADKTVSISLHGNGKTEKHDYVVSTLPPSLLQSSFSTNPTSPLSLALKQINTAATVMVVNLYYSDPDLIPRSQAGFGYLIPRSIPLEQNPERALGVIFSSYSSGPRRRPPSSTTENSRAAKSAEHDVSDREAEVGQDTAPGTKLTVMLGGHWWSNWSPTDLPSEDEAIAMSQRILSRHLSINTVPTLARAKLAQNAIPQYPVHYREYMKTIHSAVLSTFGGRLKVAGPWYQGGVGVNDCIKKALEVSMYIRDGMDETTGLQQYQGDEVWYVGNPARFEEMRIDRVED